MYKLNSILFGCLLIMVTLSGCGMPGPLYQVNEQQPTNSAETQTKEQPKEQPTEQQEP